ncbi:uncharacterized protein LACBIDRAFT_307453 [Laccaria bicolor S238N-H82]|uniref:Predicted protein n=1 Tax=Laccaria bicolor (strain S238N-H82 / ATCC MYA-4686) TaxID=486041 RepID=B0DQ65_LACBS|nr:uncharacterized protein LACBIDRAFT_307453 [Laccaria bicolor S238N-H82]EDR03330.1 predicted protein [Laccaria bicolor S238N-H82]|eukprot:XP_001886126.1 predicted protein [Laccaria bicolor S238N-H82]
MLSSCPPILCYMFGIIPLVFITTTICFPFSGICMLPLLLHPGDMQIHPQRSFKLLSLLSPAQTYAL